MEEIRNLREANERLSKRRNRKRKYLQSEGPLQVLEGQERADNLAVEAQFDHELAQDAPIVVGGVKPVRQCGICKKTGHNARTCLGVEEQL
jgi:hypothetical protein